MGKILIPGGSGGAASDDCTAEKAHILAGYTAITRDSADEPAAGTMPNNGTQSASLNCGQSKVIPAGYTGGGTVTANSLASQTPSNAGAGHLLSGYRAWMNGADTWGSMPSMGSQTVNPTNYQQVVYSSGHYMTGHVYVNPVSNLNPANIKKGTIVGGVVGTWEGYVASPTDLYYNGSNAAGLYRLNGALEMMTSSFETTYIQITMETTANNVGHFVANRSYNFSGYNNLYFQFYSQVTRKNGLRIELYKNSDGSGRLYELKTGDLVYGQTYTVSIPLTEMQTTYIPCIGFSNNLVGSPAMKFQLNRIWLS